ncbi:hypothetical protein GCM10010431_14320 [Streptomyces kunmingensis]
MQAMVNGADLPPRTGGYTVERVLGAGGMGTVYLARSRGGRAVALKVARPEPAADPHFRARFRAEVEAARKVGGFHTAPVVDADPDAEAPWLATAYIPGPALAELIERQGPMDAGYRAPSTSPPWACSGARYPGVPKAAPGAVSRVDSTARATGTPMGLMYRIVVNGKEVPNDFKPGRVERLTYDRND